MTINVPTSRGFFGYGCAALAGIVSALILAYALLHSGTILVLAAYIAAVPLFMAGFGLGLLPGFFAAGFGAACLFAVTPAAFGIYYLVADAVPALALMAIAMRPRLSPRGTIEWASEGALASALAVYPCLVFLGIFILLMGQDGGLLAMTLSAFDDFMPQVNAMLAQNGQTVTPDMTLKVHDYLQSLAYVAPALAMCAWIFSTLIALIAAQALLQQHQWSLRPAFSLVEMRMPNWMVFVVAVAALAGALAPSPFNYVGTNVAIALSVPFFFVGLAVVHAWAASKRFNLLILIAVYLIIAIIPYLALPIILIGGVDQWADFRKRLAAKTPLPN